MKKIMAGLVIAVICFATAYFALGFHKMSQNQSDLKDLSESSNLQSCKDIRKNVCVVGDGITESDYPESCFENGENILENPYECPS